MGPADGQQIGVGADAYTVRRQNYVALLQPRFLGAEVFRDGIDHRVGRTVGKFRLLHVDADRGQAAEASGGDDIIDDGHHTAGRDGKSQALHRGRDVGQGVAHF